MAKRASRTSAARSPARPKSRGGSKRRRSDPADGTKTAAGTESTPTTAGGSTATCQPDEHGGEPLAIDLEACQRAAAIFRALGDPQRLRILIMLEASERCVSEMSLLLGDSMPAISQRLRLLRGERIVRTRREGKHVYYGLADEHISRLVTNALMHALEHTIP